MYRCSIGIVSAALRTWTSINLERAGAHPNFLPSSDVDGWKTILVVTTDFDDCT
jgi:hypothetical protein